ncbi:MAG: molybdate ABC transporter substrate-binding protein [Myxococcota bacterium]|nr:molybdate ABC transporter substrate-binding protein [Myxococcota bacterium]
MLDRAGRIGPPGSDGPRRAPQGRVALAAVLAASSIAACTRPERRSPEPLRVAAAADLSFAFGELGAAYERATGRKVVFSFGSTGLLEKQIADGAPFDVFAAANISFVDDAIKANACLPESKALYAVGRLVLVPAATEGTLFFARSLSDLKDARVKRIAIANPSHAPYGRAAQQALQRAGLWDTVSSKIVYGENVQQAFQFAQTGNADAAIVALSLVTAGSRDWTLIPADLHERLDQALVVCTHGKAGVAAGHGFASYVSSGAGRAVMRKYGLVPASESITGARPAEFER